MVRVIEKGYRTPQKEGREPILLFSAFHLLSRSFYLLFLGTAAHYN